MHPESASSTRPTLPCLPPWSLNRCQLYGNFYCICFYCVIICFIYCMGKIRLWLVNRHAILRRCVGQIRISSAICCRSRVRGSSNREVGHGYGSRQLMLTIIVYPFEMNTANKTNSMYKQLSCSWTLRGFQASKIKPCFQLCPPPDRMASRTLAERRILYSLTINWTFEIKHLGFEDETV